MIQIYTPQLHWDQKDSKKRQWDICLFLLERGKKPTGENALSGKTIWTFTYFPQSKLTSNPHFPCKTIKSSKAMSYVKKLCGAQEETTTVLIFYVRTLSSLTSKSVCILKHLSGKNDLAVLPQPKFTATMPEPLPGLGYRCRSRTQPCFRMLSPLPQPFYF